MTDVDVYQCKMKKLRHFYSGKILREMFKHLHLKLPVLQTKTRLFQNTVMMMMYKRKSGFT